MTRRLPGFAFEHRAPVLEDVLPRMDVAAIAGFAARGPVHVAVPIEDPAQFAEVFGADAPLAWDAEAGQPLYAQLGPAVRMFFANGGRRCWVLRCAGAAATATFPVPGVAMVTSGGRFAPLRVAARAPGSWADRLTVSASLTSRRFALLHASPGELLIAGAPSEALVPGDLLRVTWRAAGVELYACVDTAGTAGATPVDSPPGHRGALRVRTARAAWFERHYIPSDLSGTARIDGDEIPATFVTEPSPADAADERMTLELAAPTTMPQPGAMVVATFGSRTLLLCVGDVRHQQSRPTSPFSPAIDVVTVAGRGLWQRTNAGMPDGTPVLERLSLDLWARDPERGLLRICDLALGGPAARHVTHLPSDATVYGVPETAATWADAIAPRFPLAAVSDAFDTTPLCIPFGATAVPERFLSVQLDARAALERDGLAPFSAALFADAAVAGSRATSLLLDAEYARVLAPGSPRELAGLHRLLDLEEVTVLAVPDASQPGWVTAEPRNPAPAAPRTSTAVPECVADDFTACDDVGEPAPEFTFADAEGSNIVLQWSGPADGRFRLEQASRPDWADAAAVFSGRADTVTLPSRTPGDYYFRVRLDDERSSDWSPGVVVRLTGAGTWRACNATEYDADTIVAIHRMLLRVCAARRDVMAVLSLPRHYRETDAARHVQRLGDQTAPPIELQFRPGAGGTVSRQLVDPLSGMEREAIDFGAVYHGWLDIRDGGTVRAIPADGAVCGVIARRALARGAWVAPANEPLRGVIALDRPAVTAQWLPLQQLQINVMRQEARGFVVMSADTLAGDEDVRPINVRRLLILLRRVATRLGARYVFEPNNAAFRRGVQRGFEALLGTLFERGAFAGSRAATAFQVITGESLNTPASVDAARFVVELRVAPARPMSFLTVRLVRAGDAVTVEG